LIQARFERGKKKSQPLFWMTPLKMKAAGSSRTVVSYFQTARCHMPEECNLSHSLLWGLQMSQFRSWRLWLAWLVVSSLHQVCNLLMHE
jgi:hypothetical protein